MWILK
ncbi:unnamed protein product [Acanthoscelides obtectus]